MWWESNPQTCHCHVWAIKTSESHWNDQCVQGYINNITTSSYLHYSPNVWVTRIVFWHSGSTQMNHRVNDLTRGGNGKVFPAPALCTFRQLGWTISLQMEHSISMKLNLSSSSSSVSSFPASLHTTHTAVWGRTGCMEQGQRNNKIHFISISHVIITLSKLDISTILLSPTHRDALPHYAGLLHAARPSELLHVLAEVTLSTLGPEARFTLSAARPPASGTRRAAVGWQLDGWRSPHLGLRPVGCTLLEDK